MRKHQFCYVRYELLSSGSPIFTKIVIVGQALPAGGTRMRARTLALATFVALIFSFVLSTRSVKADPYDDWYQGRQGRWVQEQNAWRFRDSLGNEYRQYGDSWRWGEQP